MCCARDAGYLACDGETHSDNYNEDKFPHRTNMLQIISELWKQASGDTLLAFEMPYIIYCSQQLQGDALFGK